MTAFGQLHSTVSWLEGTRLSSAIVHHGWVIPAVQCVHIVCLSVVIASVAMLNARLLQAPGDQSIARMAQRLLPWVWGSLCFLAVTGALLIIGEPARELLNKAFQLKMILVAFAASQTAFLQLTLRKNPDYWSLSSSRRQLGRGLALLSMTVWIVILICGRWIAYTQYL